MNEARILIFLAVSTIAVLFTGCSSSSGWRFEIGVSPINGLENTAQFEAVKYDNEDRRY